MIGPILFVRMRGDACEGVKSRRFRLVSHATSASPLAARKPEGAGRQIVAGQTDRADERGEERTADTGCD